MANMLRTSDYFKPTGEFLEGKTYEDVKEAVKALSENGYVILEECTYVKPANFIVNEDLDLVDECSAAPGSPKWNKWLQDAKPSEEEIAAAKAGYEKRKGKRGKILNASDEAGNASGDSMSKEAEAQSVIVSDAVQGPLPFKVGALPYGVLARVDYECAQEAGRRNRNRRIYHEADAIAAVEKSNKRAESGALFMLGGHPNKTIKDEQAHSKNSEVAGLGRSVRYNENTGIVSLTEDILDTPEGRSTFTILAAGGSLPISSRTAGKMTVEKTYSGKFAKYEAKEDAEPLFVLREYDFIGWDHVPGVQGVENAIFRPRDARGSNKPVSINTNTVLPKESLMSGTNTVVEAAKTEVHENNDVKLITENATLRVEVEGLKKNIVEGQGKASALEAKLTEVATENATLKTEVEALRAKIPAPAPVKDPVVVALEAKVEQLEAENRKVAMERVIHEAVGKSQYSNLLSDVLESFARQAKDAAEVPKLVTVAESLISHIGTRLRTRTPTAKPVGRPDGVAGSADSQIVQVEEAATMSPSLSLLFNFGNEAETSK